MFFEFPFLQNVDTSFVKDEMHSVTYKLPKSILISMINLETILLQNYVKNWFGNKMLKLHYTDFI